MQREQHEQGHSHHRRIDGDMTALPGPALCLIRHAGPKGAHPLKNSFHK